MKTFELIVSFLSEKVNQKADRTPLLFFPLDIYCEKVYNTSVVIIYGDIIVKKLFSRERIKYEKK